MNTVLVRGGGGFGFRLLKIAFLRLQCANWANSIQGIFLLDKCFKLHINVVFPRLFISDFFFLQFESFKDLEKAK